MRLLKLLLIFIIYTISYSNDTIKIVYNTGTPPLKFTDVNNKPNGMFIEIWKLWAQKNNLQIEFIESSWEETLQMIKDGRADIHAGIYYTKERSEFLDYSEKPFFTNKKYFFYDSNISEIFKIEDLKPYVIGVDNGYPVTYMKNEHPDFYWVEYESADSVNKAFFNNKFKVVLSSLSSFYYYLKKNNLDENNFKYSNATYAFSKDYYGAVKKGNKELLTLINKGFEKISDEELSSIELKWTEELTYAKLNGSKEKLLFTEEEYNYLNSKKELKMCIDPDWLPFEKLENGKHQGIVSEIFKLFKKDLNIPIKIVETTSWKESLTTAKLRRCDILSAVVKTPEREKYLSFTKPYMAFPEVLVTREKEPFIANLDNAFNKKIGVVGGYVITELLKNRYPHINLIETEDIIDGLYKVGNGELYGFVGTLPALTYALAKNGMTNLKISSKVGIDYKIRIGSRSDEAILTSIFNKLIERVDKQLINKIEDDWLKIKLQEEIDYTLIYKILAWFSVIIILIFYWNRKLKQEITERTKAQEELSKFLQIIEQSQVSIMLTDLEGTILYVNPHCAIESGYTKEELLGNKPNIFKSGLQSAQFYDELWRTIKSGETWHGEFSNRRKDGTLFWVKSTIAPIFDDEKNIKYFTSIKQDITDRVNTQEKLIVAQNEANEANDAKSDFLANMSHEIRTPMNAVLGMLYLLEKTQLKDNQKDYIKKANAAANSLLGIINDILDFSKIEANKLEIKRSEFNIYELLTETTSILSVKAEDNNIELLTSFDEEIPVFIRTDRLRLAQILNNLISNAIKFTHDGEVFISIKLLEKDSEGNVKLKFCVKDTGIGISKENQSKLFNEFTQVDESVTRSFHGTGLGLVISKKLSKLLGGEIWIEESIVDIGTTICFTIDAKISTKKEYLGFIFPNGLNNLRVLLVDDNNLALEVLSGMLDSFGYTTTCVNNGYEAIDLLREESFDLVFLDYKMPKMNGLETYKKYKSILKEKTPKTLIVTAYINEVIQKNVEDLGISGYLQKPISPSYLYDKIIDVLSSDKVISKIEDKDTDRYFEKTNILLVEDNVLNSEIATMILEGFGLDVDVAIDGIEAIEKIITQKYKLVLMDIQMPRLDGLEASKKIRELNEKYFKELPIIALSANALVKDRQKSLDAGMNDHITKPIDVDVLFNVLKKYLPTTNNITKKEDVELKFKYIDKLDKTIFNVQDAMNRVSNNENIYIKILHQFNNNYKDVLEYIDKLLRNNELEELEKKVHEIKGIAGNIAAKRLFKVLSKMNAKLINGLTLEVELLEEFKKELNEVFRQIEKIKYSPENKTKKFDKKVIIENLYDLRNCLESDIVHSEEIVDELSSYVNSSKYANIYEELKLALDSFDTDNAKEIVDKFLKVLDDGE